MGKKLKAFKRVRLVGEWAPPYREGQIINAPPNYAARLVKLGWAKGVK